MQTRRRTTAILTELAEHLARGGSASKFAADHNIPKRTASEWAALPEVREQANAIKGEMRRQAVDRAVTTLGLSTAKAAARLVTLLDDLDPNVRLRAIQTALKSYSELASFAELDERIAHLESIAKASQQDAATYTPRIVLPESDGRTTRKERH